MSQIFVTGISTEVGKTMASAVLVEAMQADYWKPVQAGDLDDSDSDKVRDLISNTRTVIHPNAYALHTPMSPHAAAEKDGILIALDRIVPPSTDNHLVIEGAGGLLVPLNQSDTILDLIQPHYRVVVVSRHYLGSINHTLLTVNALQLRGINPFLLYSGDPHPTTESIIESRTNLPVLGRIEEQADFTKEKVKTLSTSLRPALEFYGFL
jgi:dethiobiotin synthetase